MTKISTSHFKRLIGTWRTSGQIYIESKTLELSGTDTYEFILDGHYILHKADVKMGDERSQTFEIISLDKSGDTASMQFFNSKEEQGVMTGQIKNHAFLIEGDGLKFSGTILPDDSEIQGTWYQQTGKESWKEFIKMKLEKQI